MKINNICRFLDGVFNTFTILISEMNEKFERQNITIQGVFIFDYKSNDNSLFWFTQISHWKIENATIIDNFSIIRIDIIIFAIFTFSNNQNKNASDYHSNSDNSNKMKFIFVKTMKNLMLKKMSIEGLGNSLNILIFVCTSWNSNFLFQ